MLSQNQLDEMIRRCEAATPGPWQACWEGRDQFGGESVILTPTGDLYLTPGRSLADHDFIAHARQDVPTLLAEVERLTQLLAAQSDKQAR